VKERDHPEDLVVDGRIINWILKIGWKGVVRMIWLRTGTISRLLFPR
jgi:hypothetical protein